MDQSKRILKRAVFFLPLALLIALFECIPLMGMVVKAFLADGQLSLGNFIKAFQEPAYQVAMLNSLWITILSSLAGLVVDFFLAMALSGSRGRGNLHLFWGPFNNSFYHYAGNFRSVCAYGTAGRISASCRLQPLFRSRYVHHLSVLSDPHGDAAHAACF